MTAEAATPEAATPEAVISGAGVAGERPRRRWGLQAAVTAVLLFLNVPVLVVFLYAFTTEDQTFTFPPPGFTLHWFDVAWDNQDVRDALWLSVRVAGLSTILALVLGTLCLLYTSDAADE